MPSPFSLLSGRLQDVAEACLGYATKRHGKGGLQVGEPISDKIAWRPTFFLKPSRTQLLAFEVSDQIYPQILKIAAHDILTYDLVPVTITVVCPLDVFQADRGQRETIKLAEHGFGLCTVDETNHVVRQRECVPLIQHISDDKFESEVRPLAQKNKVLFREAYKTYSVNPIQGVQQAAKLVEATIHCLSEQCVKQTWLKKAPSGAADQVDALFALAQMTSQRAALGAARGFLKLHRNPASHAPKNGRAAAKTLAESRVGFLTAIRTHHDLVVAAKHQGFRIALPR